jgi:hypothetical protein
MTALDREGAGMTRSRRNSIRRIALGLAVAALISPAAAQARPLDIDGGGARSLHQLSVPLTGSEDVAFSRQPAGRQTAAVGAHEDKGYEAGVGSLAGLVLILAAAGAAVAVHHGRKAKLSPA